MNKSIWHKHPTIDKIEVSANGAIRCIKTKKLYTPTVIGKGYLSVHIRNKNNKRFYVHRLVAETFIPNPENKPQVNHKNGIKTDNRADNLEWVSCKENINHAIKTGLNTQAYKNKTVLCITNGKIYKSCRHAARTLGIGFSQIQGVCSGRYKQTHGFQFRFLDDLLAFETELKRIHEALEQSEICCTEWEKQALDYKAENITLSGKLECICKALDVAVDALKFYSGKPGNWLYGEFQGDYNETPSEIADKALEQITTLEQEDIK